MEVFQEEKMDRLTGQTLSGSNLPKVVRKGTDIQTNRYNLESEVMAYLVEDVTESTYCILTSSLLDKFG